MTHARSTARLLLIVAAVFGIAACTNTGQGLMNSAASPSGFTPATGGGGGGAMGGSRMGMGGGGAATPDGGGGAGGGAGGGGY